MILIMYETEDYKPPFKSELQQLTEEYEERLQTLFDGPVKYQMLSLKDNLGQGEQNRAIFVTRAGFLEGDYTAVCFTDLDDTIVPYSERKKEYFKSLLNTISSESPELIENALLVINRAARARPYTGVGPEKYSPLLEMVTDTVLLEALKKHRVEKIRTLLENPTEENARRFILDEVVPKFSNLVDTFTDTNKSYFREAQHQALAVNWNQRPQLVSENVWDSYLANMTQPRIPENEIMGLDIDPNIYWIVSTFGEIGFQTEKVVNALQLIKEKTGRVPNGILLFTRGRKEPVVSKIIDEFPDKLPILALDDSLEQLIGYFVNPRITPIRADRTGTKRANKPTPEGMLRIDMERGNLKDQLRNIIDISTTT